MSVNCLYRDRVSDRVRDRVIGRVTDRVRVRHPDSLGNLLTRHKMEFARETLIQKSGPRGHPSAVSNGCIVQYLCSSLVFVLHFLMLLEFDFVLMTGAYSQCLK